MTGRKSFAHAIIVVLLSSAAILIPSTSAFAARSTNWHRVGGSLEQRNWIDLGVDVSFYQYVGLQTSVSFGSSATSATGCKITGWLILRRAGQTSTWEGPRNTFNCRWALDNTGTAVVNWWPNWSGSTSGDVARGRVCVDLYYNGSSSSGWQRCYTGPEVWRTE
ncbi:hypothetical protein AB0M79_22910 [Polymorphospora sp. NPDC051019]|uniref:hypothetical protein n=1 Tax=Polymorphospora sp. NPDC051019 TaxID=3155725 RepID=UPI00341EB09A